MLKKIPVSQVRLGMHLHALEGAWIDHPFWRTRFVIANDGDLKRLRESSVREIWIDVAKGLDVVAAPAPSAVVAPVVDAPAPAARAPAAPPPPNRSFTEELQQAAAICNQGRGAVKSMFREARLGRAVDAQGCLPLVNDIADSVMRNPGALVSLARLKTQDDYSYMHSVAVCALMVALAREIELPDDECRAIGLAGLMHDLGKALMPPAVLNKPGKLTDEEWALMKTHPERGWALLEKGSGQSEVVADVCLHHHEKLDGSGYPHGLAGESISRVARMGAICDVYDAITSNRPYKAGWDPAESIARMASWKGHFDPELFTRFVRSLGIYPVGSLVRLESGKLAVVVEQNAHTLTSPVVKVFYSTRSKMPVPVQRLDLAGRGCNDRIVGRESAAAWGFTHLNELWADPAALKAM